MPDDNASAATAPVLVLVRDLLFASKIAATARTISIPIMTVRDPGQLGARPGRLVIVDLNQPGAMEAAVEWKRVTGGEIIGFVSHVDEPTIERARASGFDRVLARSQFVQQLPELLR